MQVWDARWLTRVDTLRKNVPARRLGPSDPCQWVRRDVGRGLRWTFSAGSRL